MTQSPAAQIPAPAVLIADDSSIVRHTLAAALGRLGIEVIEAADGAKALEVIARRRPNLVILDVFMPVLDGLEVLRSIRGQEDLRRLPVFLLTSSEDKTITEQATDLRVDSFLLKTELNPSDLRQRVGRYLRIDLPERDWDPELSSKTILVAAGPATDTASVARLLSGWGCGVIPTDNVEEAMHLIRDGHQDAIIVDTSLASKGRTMLSYAVAHFRDAKKQVPILALTATSEDVSEPVSAVLRHPLNEGTFHQVLRELLRGSQQQEGRLFDPLRLMEVADGDATLAQDMVATFTTDAPPILTAIEAAGESQDHKAMANEAHALKGMLDLVGVNVDGGLYRRIAEMATGVELTCTADEMSALRQELQQLIEALATLRVNGDPAP